MSDAARTGRPLGRAREEFYRRLEEAFSYFETKVAEGRIAGYGVSSNSVVAAASAADATSLPRMLAAARKAGGDGHHFRVLQLPLNLLETGAILERSADNGAGTVLDAASAEDIAVLVNRPLNAFVRGSLLRLADVEIEEDSTSPFDEQLGRLADLEFTFHTEIAPKLAEPEGSGAPSEIFRFAESLSRLQQATYGLAHWSQIEAQINHGVHYLVVALNSRLEGETADAWAAWRDSYLAELEDLLRRLRAQASRTSAAQAAALRAAIDPLLPAERRSESLSRKALWTVTSTPGVTCVLNGMRSSDYVDDSSAVMRWDTLESVERIYAAASAAAQQLV